MLTVDGSTLKVEKEEKCLQSAVRHNALAPAQEISGRNGRGSPGHLLDMHN